MKKIIGIITVVLLLVAFAVDKNLNRSNECCGKCVGSSNCSACSTCNYCKYCNSGGSCGTCRTSATPKTEKPKTTTLKHKVISNTLNMRSAPNANATVIYTLSFGNMVTIIEIVNETWAKVSFNEYTGYVSKQFLSK